MRGSIADQVKEVTDGAFVNIGLAYYEGVRDLRGLRIWCVCYRELQTLRWVKRNPEQALTWIQNGIGENVVEQN